MSILPTSSILDDRLANPLIGICSVPLTSQGVQKGFTVLQMSSAGDIFYQSFTPSDKGKSSWPDNPGTSKDSKDQKISAADIRFLEKWINELVAMNNEHDELPFKSNVVETDFRDLFRTMMFLEEPHPSCELCNLDRTIDFNVEYSDEDCVCPRCGIGVKYGAKLKKSNTLDFPCPKEIKLKDPCADLNIIVNTNSFQDPLSKNLLRNWFSNTPEPLNLESTKDIDKETAGPSAIIITSDANVKNEDEENKEADRVESSQLSNKVVKLEQTIIGPDEGQGLDSPMKTLEFPTLSPAKSSVQAQSPSKLGSSLPSKQVKGVKRKLNQSQGF